MRSAGHETIVDRYLEDLTAVADEVRRGRLTGPAREARYS